MALQPTRFTSKERLQPGARGEIFQANLPGYRDGEERINRTMSRLNMNDHDVLNIKYMLDDRLPDLFRYGFAFGYNQIVIPKGRIVAVDPQYTMIDFDMQKEHNVLTLANGGVHVKLRESSGETEYKGMASSGRDAKLVSGDMSAPEAKMPGIGKEWMPKDGFAAHYKNGKVFMSKSGSAIDPLAEECEVHEKGHGPEADGSRLANIPIGILERNEYTRDNDAFNGMMPGPVRTDAMVELPYFLHKDKAEQNPWGSAYGALKPGMLVKSDENGRVVMSPLSGNIAGMSIEEYEAERQQVIGQVYEVKEDLIPEGAAKYAQWALQDILNFEEFNPDEWRQTNRRDNDVTKNSPHNSTGEYPGYPYDKAYKNSDLHMLESYRGTFDQRMQHEYRFDYGIPGLTDGYNAVKNEKYDVNVGTLQYAGSEDREYANVYIRSTDTRIDGNLKVVTTIGDTVKETAVEDGAKGVGTEIEVGATGGVLKVDYVNYLQGLIVLKVDKTAAKTLFDANDMKPVHFGLKYEKRGQAGVPTFMDWDGCKGSVKILLQK